jgi:hypothetical protein
VGAYQAERAREEMLRFAMASIAGDEARHAALSHDIHAWLMPQLDADARRRIAQSQQAMIAALHAESEQPEIRELAGLPSADFARHMLAALERELWTSVNHAA